MSKLTNFAENKLVDAVLRGQASGLPATWHMGVLLSTHGPRANSTVYSTNNTISVLANDGILHLYKCTTGGTTAAAQSTLYPGVYDENITDGTAVFAEQSPELDDGTALVEPAVGAYARVAVTASLTNYSGTQGAGTTVASTGTGGLSSNNIVITWPNPVGANWGFAWAHSYHDAATSGNCWIYAPYTTAKTINDGDAAPSIAIGNATVTLG